MSDTTKTPEQLAQEHRREGVALRSAISQFNMKLRFIENDSPFEDQIESLSHYNDIPNIEEIKSSEKRIDSYRELFFNQLIEEYFKEYPEMLELIGDKKSDNPTVNFIELSLKDFLFASNDEEDKKKRHIESVSAYYHKVLPKYYDFLIDYIVDNNLWNLTKNSKDDFIKFVDIHKKHKYILDKHNVGMDINMLIKDINEILIPEIVELDKESVDNWTYSTVVENVVIGKYNALQSLMNHMAGGGLQVLQLWIGVSFKDYTLSDILQSINHVRETLKLNDSQKQTLDSTEKLLQTLQNKGFDPSTPSKGGCFGVLLVLLIPISAILLLI